ncbi:hypothetical protein PHYC_03883 [Phycisphaerales bacterium]|nr:hypothetical protein PHYC_03883 [Phycisphaerales bacterium]
MAVMGLVAGILATVPALYVAIASGGGGHGDYVFTRILFPLPMLLTALTGDSISALSILLAVIQFPLYGLAFGAIGRPRNARAWMAVGIVIGLHALWAALCFAGLLPNFS